MRLIGQREFVNPRYDDGCHSWLRECLVLCLDKYIGKVSSIRNIEGTFTPFSSFILERIKKLDVREQKYNKIGEL